MNGQSWVTVVVAGALMGFAGVPARGSGTLGDGQRVVFLGDSLTSGYGLLPAEAFPGLVSDRIRARGWGFSVVNAGVSGDTSAQALARAPGVVRDGVDVLVLFLGANDGLERLPVPALRRNLEKIIALARKRNPRVRIFMLSMRMPTEWGRYSAEFNEMYPTLAYRQKIAELPWVMEGIIGQLDLTLADGFHPNARGHAVMADRVWKGLEPILKKAAAGAAAAPRP